MLFCGDTLFAAGCGRLFEGTPGQMHASLNVLANLPEDTRVFCGHEYTLANLEFARTVEPGNTDITRRIAELTPIRERNRPTLPSAIGEEIKTNPFLRCHLDSVRDSAQKQAGRTLGTAVEVFAAVRAWKDHF
jgi:hydroxyacylglutathione hydrolase